MVVQFILNAYQSTPGVRNVKLCSTVIYLKQTLLKTEEEQCATQTEISQLFINISTQDEEC